MRAIHLVGVGSGVAESGDARVGAESADSLLAALAPALEQTFGMPCTIAAEDLDAEFAFAPARNQYHSTAILRRLTSLGEASSSRILGVTDLDLYVPVLTFVFGEAQLEGSCAVVSSHRLREEFYGLPARSPLLHERLLKEAVHELGHTFGLRHCDRWDCVMASTHAVERLDLKGADFCPVCRDAVEASG